MDYEKYLEKQVKEMYVQKPEENAENPYKLLENAPAYTESFLTEEAFSQSSFYDEYKQNWKSDYQGNLTIAQSLYKNPVDIAITKDNQKFFAKKGIVSKKKTHDQVNSFNNEIKKMDQSGAGIKAVGSGPRTEELMCANLRLAAIQKKKDEIIDDAYKKATKNNKKMLELIGDYMPYLRDLGPELVAQYTTDVNDEVKFDEASVKEYTNFIERAFTDPVITLGEAINDALHSYGRISTKLLVRDNIPGKFDRVKQLRDKYKAVHVVMRSQSNAPGVKDILKDIRSKSYLRDNILFATEMYKRLDADLCYAMETNSLTFTSDKFLDHTEKESEYYKSDGELTRTTLVEQKNMVKDKSKESSVDHYWREALSERLRMIKFKDEVKGKEGEKGKEEKGKEGKSKRKRKVNLATEKISDGADIIATADNIAKDFDTTDDYKQKLFDELKTNVSSIAAAIKDMNHDLEMALYLQRNQSDAEKYLRPELRSRLSWYVTNRKQQVLNLFDRVSGYLNAMRYLTGKSKLNENGAQIIKSIQTKIKKSDDTEDENSGSFISSKTDTADMNSQGPGKDIVTLAKSSMTFTRFKKEIIEKQPTNVSGLLLMNELQSVLNSKDASLKYDFLMLEGMDLMKLDAQGVINAFRKADTEKEKLDKYIKAYKTHVDEVDILYERLVGDDIYALSDEERNEVVERCVTLKKRNLALQRIGDENSGGMKYKLHCVSKLGGDPDFQYRRTDLTKLKYKIIMNKLDIYRYRSIYNQLQIGTANDDMYTEDEKNDLKALFKKEKVNDDVTENGRSKDAISAEYFVKKMADGAQVDAAYQVEMVRHLNKNSNLKTYENKKQKMRQKAIELEKKDFKNRYDQKKKVRQEEKERQRSEKERLEKERLEKEKLEKERLEKEKLEAERLEKERLEKENNKDTESSKKSNRTFTEAKDLKTKYNIKVAKKDVNFPYSGRKVTDPASDSWAHALSSLINGMTGRYVVTGQMLLEDEDMKDKEVFGPERNKEGEPKDYADLVNKYIPNTSIAKTTFDDYEYQTKDKFLDYVKNALSNVYVPVMLKRKGSFISVYGIDKNNQLLCKRASTEDSSKLYTEDPDEVFDDMKKQGEVAMYWLCPVDDDMKPLDLVEIDQKVEYSIPSQQMDDKKAYEHVQNLKEIEVASAEPEVLKVKDKVVVEENEIHAKYEKQGGTLYCWACAMNGMLNYHANREVSNLDELNKYNMQIPDQKDTNIRNDLEYVQVVDQIEQIKSGEKVGNPMIFGDYIFEKLPGSVVKSAIIPFNPDKVELCKRRFKETLSLALEKGPVALLRNGHFVLVHELDGNKIKVKNSSNDDPDIVEEDHYTIDSLYDPEKALIDIELVWIENLKGNEKELVKEFDDVIYDEEKKEFKKKVQKDTDGKPRGFDTILHKNGIEVTDLKDNDVVTKTAYIPIKMQEESK